MGVKGKAGKLTRSVILEMADRATSELEVPEWGGAVILREWGLPERGAFVELMEKQRSGEKSMADAMAMCVVLSVVDEDGNRLFSEKDIPIISRKSGKAAERIFKAAMSLNMVPPAEIKELEGN